MKTSNIPSLYPTTSSYIRSLGYDCDALFVQFKDGAIWRYFDVPPDAAAALMQAKSVGSHFHAYVKNSYKAERVAQREAA